MKNKFYKSVVISTKKSYEMINTYAFKIIYALKINIGIIVNML